MFLQKECACQSNCGPRLFTEHLKGKFVAAFVERILILAKTYPSPSAKYVETSCVAGINEEGQLRRLYPVPFRLIEEGKQFKKWQWITARIRKSNNDHRPESHRIYVDTIECDAEPLSTKNQWEARWPSIDRLPAFTSFADVEKQRLATSVVLHSVWNLSCDWRG